MNDARRHHGSWPTPGSWSTLVVALLLLGPPAAVALRGLQAPMWLALSAPVLLVLAIGLLPLRVPALPVALARRHPLLATAWVLLLLAAAGQTARASLYANDAWQRQYSVDPSSAFRTEHYCMTAYAEAARFAAEGRENIYDARLYTPPFPKRRYIGPLTVDPFHYPPPFLLVPATVHLVAPDFFDARRVWFGLQVLLMAAAVLLVAWWVGGAPGQYVALASIIPWAAPPVYLALQTGNFQVSAISIAMLGAVLTTGRHVPMGALFLVFAAVAKVFPSMLVLHVVATRRWRVLIAMTVAAAVLALATAAWFGTAPFARFVLDEFPRLASGASFPQTEQPGSAPINASIYGLTTKFRRLGLSWMDASAGKRIAQLYAALLALFALFSGWREGRAGLPADAPSRLRLAILWLAILNLASFASPFVGIAYGVVGTIWILSLLVAWAATPRARAAWVAVLLAALVPTLIINAPGVGPPAVPTLMLALVGQGLVVGVNAAAAWLAIRS